MPQSLSKIALHLIFSTKNRERAIRDEDREELAAYVIGILKNHGSPSIQVAVQHDHLHILFFLSRTITCADIVRHLKVGTGSWLKTRNPRYHQFAWQSGYGIFSVSESNIDAVVNYIKKQDEHHQSMTFQDEYRSFCTKHRLSLDERYAWD